VSVSARSAAHPAAVVSAQQPLLRLCLASDTTLSLPLTRAQAVDLKAALEALTHTLAAKAKPGARPQRWPLMEWRLRADDGSSAGGAVKVRACVSAIEQRCSLPQEMQLIVQAVEDPALWSVRSWCSAKC
jgi:hypothetical protein